MSAVVPLPNVLHTVTQQEITAESEQVTAAFLLTGAMSELRRSSACSQRDPMHAGKLARGMWALARWREAERRWKNAEYHCEIARSSLALQAAKTMGVCVVCSATTNAGYCDACREEREAPPF